MDRAALRMLCSPQFWRMAVLWAVCLLYSYLLIFLRGGAVVARRRRQRPSAGRRPICVVTGATSGLGKAAAAALAQEGYYVVLAGRSTQLLSETVQEIRRKQPDAYLEAFQVDLASYKSIKKFGTLLKQWLQETDSEPSIQLLINNAGILARSHRVTEDDLDDREPSRVVNLTSFTHRCVSCIDVSENALRGMKFDQCSMAKSYPLASTYEYTKFCVLLFSYELHRQMHISSAVSVTAADPGVVETKIMRELPPCLSWFAFFVLRFLNLLQQPDTGVDAVLDAALAPPEASGKYFFGGKGRTIRSSRLSYDMELGKKLWAESSALFKELQLQECNFG